MSIEDEYVELKIDMFNAGFYDSEQDVYDIKGYVKHLIDIGEMSDHEFIDDNGDPV